ncbi:MAG TPA: MFS transporter [Verrucomicrobiae bacterium]|jgi:sugar phosphate permease|nr:MFS transporter [Verrucomicrobiae bacterium]
MDHSKTNEPMVVPLAGPQSHVRWVVLLLLCLMYLITYLDRVSMANTAPMIGKEFGFSKVTMGIIFSAFIWSYSLFQVPGGWLGDRFGPRKVLSTIMAYRTVIAVITTTAVGFYSFWGIRFSLGIGEAGAFPTATRAMQMWYPRDERGFVQGVSHAASRFGAAIGPPVAVFIMLHYGWRSVFYVIGILSLLWSLLYALAYRNMPEEDRYVSRAELARIRGLDATGEIKKANIAKRPKVPWSVLLSHGNMWAVMCAYAAYIYSLWFFLSWLPSYLVEYRHFTLIKTGLYASMPLMAGVVGDAFGGWLTDKLLVKTNNLKFSRRSVAITAMLGCGTCTMFAALSANPNTAVYCLTAAMFFLEMTIGPAWAVPMDIGGEFSGTVSGMMNMGGQFVGALSPTVFGYLVSRGSWVAPFGVSAGLLFIGAAIWAFWIDPEQSVIDRGEGMTGPSIGALHTPVATANR